MKDLRLIGMPFVLLYGKAVSDEGNTQTDRIFVASENYNQHGYKDGEHDFGHVYEGVGRWEFYYYR